MPFDGARWRIPSLLSALLLLAVTPSLAAEPVTASLQVLPRSCMPAPKQTICVDVIQLRWQLSAVLPFCIRQHGEATPLFCDGQREGERTLKLAIERTTRFELISESGADILGSTELLVLAGAGKRRRYQHPWSVF